MPTDLPQRRATNKPGLLGDHPLAAMEKARSVGGVPSLLNMPVTARGLR